MSAQSMRAAVLAGPKRVRLETVPRPRPDRGQLLVRVEGCGVCGSNLPAWEGRDWFAYPLPPGSPGHEGWGRVEAVGDGVQGWRGGERVAFLSSNAFAEFDLTAAEAAVRLPGSLDGAAFPGEALGCAMNIARRSDLRGGQTVAVVGVGFLGALLVRLAERAGARVVAVGRRPFALALARRFGAHEVVPMDDFGRVVERVKELTGGGLCERVIECAGVQPTLDLATELTGERGRLVIAGYHQDGPRQVNLQLWNWRGLDVVNAHERDPKIYVEGIRLAIEAVVSGRIDPTPLYTSFPLAGAERAFDALSSRPEGFVKALVTTA